MVSARANAGRIGQEAFSGAGPVDVARREANMESTPHFCQTDAMRRKKEMLVN